MENQISAVAHVIQLSVAPVFLLAGVGSMLGVLTNRLARIVDRARVLEVELPSAVEPQRALVHADLSVLCRRARLINWAISLCTTCALLVCLVIALLFLGAYLTVEVRGPISLLFVAAMVAFIAGLLTFLREVYLATGSLRIGPRPN